MNGTPSPRRGWRAARKREKTITVTIANTYLTKGEKSREKIASIVRPLVVIHFWFSDQQAGKKSMTTLVDSPWDDGSHFQSEQASLTGNSFIARNKKELVVVTHFQSDQSFGFLK